MKEISYPALPKSITIFDNQKIIQSQDTPLV